MRGGAEDLATGGRGTAAAGRSASENLARKIVERGGTVSREAVTKALRLCKVPQQARHNVAPEGASSIRGMTCGLFVYAERIGLSAASHRFPWLTRLLALFGRQQHPDFVFTSIQVNVNNASRPHVDRHNLGQSHIIGLGSYTGGELWIHDDTGVQALTLQEDIGREKLYRKGTLWRGRDIDICGKWAQFNGNKLHCTKPFKGTRYSLVYYTCDRYAEASPEVRESLRKTGIGFQWSSVALRKMLVVKQRERAELRQFFKKMASAGRQVGRHLVDDDRIFYEQQNPKRPGCHAHKLYSKYLRAQTVREAKRRGCRQVDLMYDFNLGYLRVSDLHAEPRGCDFQISDPAWRARPPVAPSTTAVGSAPVRGKTSSVQVRSSELMEFQAGLGLARFALARLTARCPVLRGVPEERFSARDGPTACLPLSVVRSLLGWAATGRLRCERRHLKVICDTLAAWGQPCLAEVVASRMTVEGKKDARACVRACTRAYIHTCNDFGLRWHSMSVILGKEIGPAWGRVCRGKQFSAENSRLGKPVRARSFGSRTTYARRAWRRRRSSAVASGGREVERGMGWE